MWIALEKNGENIRISPRRKQSTSTNPQKKSDGHFKDLNPIDG